MFIQVVQKFEYIAMDTEFPGVVARPMGEFKSSTDYHYQLLRCNVDLLKLIQLGVTFMDREGNLPDGITTWQFNFKFNLTEDMYAEDSIELLQNSGIQFEKHEQDGIDTWKFAEMLIVSGLVLIDNVKWISFHSHYDFGYLMALLTNQNLPSTEAEFFEVLKTYFPNVYDVKYIMNSCKNLRGGLQELGNTLGVSRIGRQHQAGSDALLTGQSFFRMKDMFFDDDIDDSKYCGHLFGLGQAHVQHPSSAKTSTPIPTVHTSDVVTSSNAINSTTDTITTRALEETPVVINGSVNHATTNGNKSTSRSPVNLNITSSLSAVLPTGVDSNSTNDATVPVSSMSVTHHETPTPVRPIAQE